MLLLQFVTLALILAHGIQISHTQADEEESLRLAWAVRKLVGGTCNASGSSLPVARPPWMSRPGKIGPVGPPGPKGDEGPRGQTGTCECNESEVTTLKENVARLENTLSIMKSLFPEAFCLLGMKTGVIPDSAITVSSIHHAGYCQITNSRLDHHGAWCAAQNTLGSQWIQVDLGKIQKVTGVVTQGQGNYPATNEWITSFKIEYGTVAGSRSAISENSHAKVFSPVNFNKNTKVVTRFPQPVQARYIRIVPASYHGHISMRFDVINC